MSRYDAVIPVANLLPMALLFAFTGSSPFSVIVFVMAAVALPLVARLALDVRRRKVSALHTYLGLLGTAVLWLPILLYVALEAHFRPAALDVSTYFGLAMLVGWIVWPWLRTAGRPALTAVLAASILGNVFLYRQLSREAAQVPYNEYSHGPLIDEAIELFSAEMGVSVEEAMSNRFPVAMTVPDTESPGGEMRCVSLKLRQGVLGFTPVYCFNRDGESARLKSQAKY